MEFFSDLIKIPLAPTSASGKVTRPPKTSSLCVCVCGGGGGRGQIGKQKCELSSLNEKK